jgi:hypothetical protein
MTYSSKTSIDFHRTTWHYIPEDRTLHKHCCTNVKSYVLGCCCCFPFIPLLVYSAWVVVGWRCRMSCKAFLTSLPALCNWVWLWLHRVIPYKNFIMLWWGWPSLVLTQPCTLLVYPGVFSQTFENITDTQKFENRVHLFHTNRHKGAGTKDYKRSAF